MDKFKVGDKVKIVKGGRGIHSKHIGETTTITSAGFPRNYGDGTRYFFETSGLTNGGHGATEDSFELIERAKPNPADLLTITWQGATITFDPSVAAGEKMVQSIIAMIYKEAA